MGQGQANGAGNNVEELRDYVGLDAHHQDSLENTEGLAVSCVQGDVRAEYPQLPHSVQNFHTGLYILCVLYRLYLLCLYGCWPSMV